MRNVLQILVTKLGTDHPAPFQTRRDAAWERFADAKIRSLRLYPLVSIMASSL